MYLDWKEQPRDVFAIDIEANDLLPGIKEIYCMCWINLKTGEKGDCVGHEDIRVFFSSNPSAIFVAHFGIGYDFPAFLKVLGVRITINQMIDTVVLSELYSPNISGGHGLDAWGERIGEAKLPFKDFSRYTEDMLVYCRQDTLICAKVFVKLIKTLDRINFSEKSIWIQHRFKLLLRDQKDNGFYFNISKAYGLHDTISKLEKELEEIVHMQFPPVKTLVAVRNKFKKNGDYTKIYLTDCSRYTVEDNQDGSYSCYEDVSFNLGSPKQRVDKLMELGWVPQDDDPKTKTGNPKPFEKGELAPSLQQFLDDNPEVTGVASIAKWMVLNGRTTMLQTWMDNYSQETGAIHGSLFVADTLRLKHSSPNTANIPAVRTGPDGPLMGDAGQWTYECRDLWEARPGRVLVGTDAAGLELRVLAHFLNKAEFTKQVLEGDPHQYNADLVGIERPKAKTVLYACVPMDTLCLTREGWKDYYQLQTGDTVLTYNQSKNVKEWKPVLEKVHYEDAPIIELRHGKGFSIRSTPNHRWFVSRRTGAKERYRVDDIRTTETVSTDCNIIVNAPMTPDQKNSSVDWTTLPKYETDWTEVVLNMSSDERKAWLSGFMVADGYYVNNWKWSQLLGPLFEAALLASYLEHDGSLYVYTDPKNKNPMGVVSLNKKRHITGQRIRRVSHPRQPVWCIKTENESFVIRQGNTITITGNTMYGVSPFNLGPKIGLSKPEGAKIYNAFLDRLQLDEVIKEAQYEQRNGRVALCDGSQVVCPSPHSALNYKFQGSGARIMALASVLLEDHIRTHGLDSRKVGDIHDEWQYDVAIEDSEAHARAAVQCIRRAGEMLELNIPLDGTSKIGGTWAETH